MINDRAEGCREFILKLFEIEQKFIEDIRKSQREFIDRYGFGHLEERHSRIIKNIFEEKKYESVSGK